MSHVEVIALYEAVAELMEKMHLAAQQEDWDTLTELENLCAEHIKTLQSIESTSPMTVEARQKKIASIKRILANDRDIRNLVSPWMARINKLLSSKKTEQKINLTYR
jgi:flagellar protein FliT